MKKISIKLNKKGFSLVEVLVFTTVLSLFFVTAMAVATYNIRNTKVQEDRILATRYAEEVVEWLRYEKESDWSIFVTHDAGATGKTYCLNNYNLDWSIGLSCGDVYPDDYSLGTPGIFKRELYIKNSGAPPVNEIDTTVTVYWKDFGTTLNVAVPTVFKLLE